MGNLQASMLGAVGFYPQVSLGTAPSSVDFYWLKAILTDLSPVELIRNLGQLVGGQLLPSGSIKTGIYSGGRLNLYPHLDNQYGWLPFAMTGFTEATPDDNGDETYVHYFPDKTTNPTTQPSKYLCLHKRTPSDGTYDLGEQFLDATVARWQLAVAGGEIVTSLIEFLAGDPTPTDVTKASPEQGWDPDTEVVNPSKDSVPIASIGTFELPDGAALTNVNGWTLDFVNITPAIGEVMVVGSYRPHSFPITGIVPVLNVVALVETKDLYQTMFYQGNEWRPDPYTTTFDARVDSHALIKASNDTEVGALSYTTDDAGATYTFTDATQDFSDWDTVGETGTAAFWIEVVNSDGSVNWGYCGDVGDGGNTEIRVWKDADFDVTGWNGPGPTGKTPSSYNIYPNRRYHLGFKAGAIEWTPVGLPLQGGRLLRLNIRGTLSDVATGLDYHVYLQNKTAAYAWPS